MSVVELLAPRGDAQLALNPNEHRLTAVDLHSGESTVLWSNSERVLWAVDGPSTMEQIALLTSPVGVDSGWAIEFLGPDGPSRLVELGMRRGTPQPRPDAVVSGRGGLDWIGDTNSVAVAIPSGGLQQVFTDGSKVWLLAASAAKRPAAVAVTQDGGTIAYIDQPSGSEGNGIFAGSMKAKPIDPIVVLPADRSGNRYAHDLAWIPPGGRAVTVIDREELGNPQGDLFIIDTATGRPTLAWTSPAGQETWSVESFAVSDDGLVVTFLTNPSNPNTRKSSSVWMLQVDGGALERFELPVELEQSQLVFSTEGVAVSGVVRSDDDPGLGAVYVVAPNGEVREIYLEERKATPVSSPIASPVSSPIASPAGSPAAISATPTT
jgi:hypothetical protein